MDMWPADIFSLQLSTATTFCCGFACPSAAAFLIHYTAHYMLGYIGGYLAGRTWSVTTCHNFQSTPLSRPVQVMLGGTIPPKQYAPGHVPPLLGVIELASYYQQKFYPSNVVKRAGSGLPGRTAGKETRSTHSRHRESRPLLEETVRLGYGLPRP